MNWGAFHRLKAGSRTSWALKVLVTEAPEKLGPAAVKAALEGFGYLVDVSEGGVPWANHVLKPESRWPEDIVAGGRVKEVSWSTLQLAAVGGHRQLTIPLAPEEYSRVALRARGAGLSIRQWCRLQLVEALDG